MAIGHKVIDHNPFSTIELKSDHVKKDFLTEDEIKAIEKLKLTQGTRMETHRDMFIFACYVGGVRVSDMLTLQCKDISKTHLIFTVRKTGRSQSLMLTNPARAILKKYIKRNSDPNSFIFPILPNTIDLSNAREVDKEISGATAYINKNLKEIGSKATINKKLSFHVSRHTFATRFLRMGAKIEIVSMALGHKAIKETEVYVTILNEEVDKAMGVFNKKRK